MKLYKNILEVLIKNNISISVVESCTGGNLSIFFTNKSGISKIFNMGLVTYSNYSKNKILNIPLHKIKKYGSVSKEIAYLMSKNLSKISDSKLCISTTGIAGPSGGSILKPIGLVFIGFTIKNKTTVFKKKFSGSRKKIQNDTVNFCIKKINELI